MCYANKYHFNLSAEQKVLLKAGFGRIYFTLITSVRELNIDDIEASHLLISKTLKRIIDPVDKHIYM